MYPEKYDFTPGSKCIFLMAKTMTNCSVSKPIYFMVDDVNKDELEAIKSEYEENEYNLCGDAYRGVSWQTLNEDELPEGFLEKKYNSALAELEIVQKKVEWLKNRII